MDMNLLFNMPVYADAWDCLADSNDEEFAKFYSETTAKAVSHAINCHNELIDTLQESTDCMIALVDALKNSGHSAACLLEQIKFNDAVIAKARGE